MVKVTWRSELPRAARMRYLSEISKQDVLNRENGKDVLFSIEVQEIDCPTEMFFIGFLTHGTENVQHQNILYGSAVPTNSGIIMVKASVTPERPIVEFKVNDVQIMAINKRASRKSESGQQVEEKQKQKRSVLDNVDAALQTRILENYPFDPAHRGGNQLRLVFAVVRASDLATQFLVSKPLYYMKRCNIEICNMTANGHNLSVNFRGLAVPRNASACVQLRINSESLSPRESRNSDNVQKTMEFCYVTRVPTLTRDLQHGHSFEVSIDTEVHIEPETWIESSPKYIATWERGGIKLQLEKSARSCNRVTIHQILKPEELQNLRRYTRAPQQFAPAQVVNIPESELNHSEVQPVYAVPSPTTSDAESASSGCGTISNSSQSQIFYGLDTYSLSSNFVEQDCCGQYACNYDPLTPIAPNLIQWQSSSVFANSEPDAYCGNCDMLRDMEHIELADFLIDSYESNQNQMGLSENPYYRNEEAALLAFSQTPEIFASLNVK